MKILYTCLYLLLLCATSVSAQSQSVADITDPHISANDATHPCITDAQYAEIERRCAKNLASLGLEHIGSQRSAAVQLAWPLRMANGLNDYSYYIISAYVDQDPASGSVKDWNCGTNTYDSHRGTDICTFPYPFYKMDNNQVEVIAAADGTIIDKNDGEFDKNCVHSSAQANYVVIQHADGTFANYFHMKKNSITTKTIGQTVTAGEYLGVVGSSGDANGPHLHFEVRTANSASAYKDPFAGGCNSLNANSWWAAQKPYTEPSILKSQVGTTDPVLAACPATETPNDNGCLAPGSAAKFYVFLRNETPGLNMSLRLLGPTGAEVTSWSQSSTVSHLASIYGWGFTLPTVQGSYTFQTVYNGITSSRVFQISSACATTTGVAAVDAANQLQVYPNPANSKIIISGDGLDNGTYTISVKNLLGQTLQSEEVTIGNNTMQQSISISSIPDGIYFVTIDNGGVSVVRKVEKR